MSTNSADSSSVARAAAGVTARPDGMAAAAGSAEATAAAGQMVRPEGSVIAQLSRSAEASQLAGMTTPVQAATVRTFVDSALKTDVVAAEIYNHLTKREDKAARVIVALDYNRPQEALQRDLRTQYDQAFRGQNADQIGAQITAHRGNVSDTQPIGIPAAASSNRDNLIAWMADHTAAGNGLRIRTTSSAHTALVAARLSENSAGSIAIETAGGHGSERQGITVPTLRAVMETRNELTNALGAQLARDRQIGAHDLASEVIGRSPQTSKLLDFATAAAKEPAITSQLSPASHQLLAANKGERGAAIGNWEDVLFPTGSLARRSAPAASQERAAETAPVPTLEVVIAGRRGAVDAQITPLSATSTLRAPAVETNVETAKSADLAGVAVVQAAAAAKPGKVADNSPVPGVLPAVTGSTVDVVPAPVPASSQTKAQAGESATARFEKVLQTAGLSVTPADQVAVPASENPRRAIIPAAVVIQEPMDPVRQRTAIMAAVALTSVAPDHDRSFWGSVKNAVALPSR